MCRRKSVNRKLIWEAFLWSFVTTSDNSQHQYYQRRLLIVQI